MYKEIGFPPLSSSFPLLFPSSLPFPFCLPLLPSPLPLREAPSGPGSSYFHTQASPLGRGMGGRGAPRGGGHISGSLLAFVPLRISICTQNVMSKAMRKLASSRAIATERLHTKCHVKS